MPLQQHSAHASRLSPARSTLVACGTRPDHDGPGHLQLTGDEIVGTSVVDAVGADYGKIESIVLDVERGIIAYAILSYGGFAGMGLRLYAIPWRLLALDWTKRCAVLDVDRDQLRAAPAFHAGNWPALNDEQWVRDLHRHFGLAPYWADETDMAGGATADRPVPHG
jgi:hypothetical protein